MNKKEKKKLIDFIIFRGQFGQISKLEIELIIEKIKKLEDCNP